MKVGIDIISTKKFGKIKRDDYKNWSKVFHPNEWDYAFKDKSFKEHLAGIFAAKEAAMKAYGEAGYEHFLDWQVKHAPAPKLIKKRARKSLRFFLSISHANGLALAIVIIN